MIKSRLENAVLDRWKFHEMKFKDFKEQFNLACRSFKDQNKLKVNHLLSNNENEVQDCLAKVVPTSEDIYRQLVNQGPLAIFPNLSCLL